MRRGTTPTIKIKLKGCDINNLEKIYVTFKQGKYEFEKSMDQLNTSDETLFIKLSQDETLQLDAMKNVLIQVAVMKGATASAAGTSGLVPAPAAGDQGKYLRGDGTYGTPTNTTYSDATQTAHGLMSVSDKKKLDGIAEGANKTTVDSELSNTSTNPVQNKAVQAELAKKAPIASPSFTGTPKVPTASAGTNNTQAASTAFVTSAISTAMAGITKLDFQVVQTLPSTGVKGTFYLIANSGSGQNVYDEYLWINNKYEKLGTREIDLSSYIKQSDMVAITNSEIDAAFA